jgi:signal transduction histidine kinase
VIAVAAFRLLRYEQARIDGSFKSAQLDRARSAAQGLKQTVRAVEDTLLESLKGLAPETLGVTLPIWVNQNPLVRNVFIWSSKKGLHYPPPGQVGTREERRFVSRYATLFDGQQPWLSATKDQPEEGIATRADSSVTPVEGKTGLGQELSSQTGRENLLDLARSRAPLSRQAKRSKSTTATFDGGWMPWFTDNRLYIIGWVRPPDRDLIWGVELELTTLLSRLITDFPKESSNEAMYVLRDGTGRNMHQSGGQALDENTAPDLTVSLSPMLPHWQVAVYFDGGSSGRATGRGFLIVSGLLVITVVAAIFFGGLLLYREAERNRRDAHRKTTFVANVSHELKTPLTSIRMYAELLREDRVKSAEKRRSYLQVIVDESRRLSRLVNNLLDFGRLEQGRKKYRIGLLDLNGFLNEFEKTHRLRIRKEGLALAIQLPEKAFQVNTDRDVLEQVLLNLVDNAIKYGDGNEELIIKLDPIGKGLQLCVLDRGPGIPSEDHRRIFEKFYRTNDSLTASQPGSGLGLSIAQKLMRDIGGDLQYEPRQGGGSCFKVIIPIRDL